MGRKTVVLADVYGAMKFTLYFVDKAIEEGKDCTLVIFGNRLYLEFLTQINKVYWSNQLKVIHLDRFPSKNKGVLYDFANIPKEASFLRRSFEKHLSKFSNADIFYTVKKYRYDIFNVVARLSKLDNNRIFLCDADSSTINKSDKPRRLVEIYHYWKILFLYSKHLIFRKEGSEYYVQTSNWFLDKNNITEIPRGDILNQVDSRWESMKEKISKSIFSKKVVFFDQDVVTTLGQPKPQLDELLIRVFDLLKKHYGPTEVGFKFHPRQSKSNVILKNLAEEFPSYIPGEFIINKQNRCLLSFASNTLAENKYSMSISLIFLLDVPMEVKSKYEEYLNARKNVHIHFPKSIWELDDLLGRSTKNLYES